MIALSVQGVDGKEMIEEFRRMWEKAEGKKLTNPEFISTPHRARKCDWQGCERDGVVSISDDYIILCEEHYREYLRSK